MPSQGGHSWQPCLADLCARLVWDGAWRGSRVWGAPGALLMVARRHGGRWASPAAAVFRPLLHLHQPMLALPTGQGSVLGAPAGAAGGAQVPVSHHLHSHLQGTGGTRGAGGAGHMPAWGAALPAHPLQRALAAPRPTPRPPPSPRRAATCCRCCWRSWVWARRRCTATSRSARGWRRWTPSSRGRCPSCWPQTWRPAASTSPPSTWSSTLTCRSWRATMCTAWVAPRAPAAAGWSLSFVTQVCGGLGSRGGEGAGVGGGHGLAPSCGHAPPLPDSPTRPVLCSRPTLTAALRFSHSFPPAVRH